MKLPSLTMSKDGEKRATIKIEMRMTLDDMVIFWLCQNMEFCKFNDGAGYNDWSEDVTKELLRKEGSSGVLESIKVAYSRYGEEIPFYRVNDAGVTDNIRLVVLEYLEIIFKV